MFFYLFFALFLFSSCTGGNYVPLIEPPAKELAKLIPMQRDEIVFAYEIWLDASFTEKGTQSFAAKVSKSDLPRQIVRQFHRNYKKGQKWYAGFNVWRAGEDIFYRAFVGSSWKPSNNGNFKNDPGAHRAGGHLVKMGASKGHKASLFHGFKRSFGDKYQYATIAVVNQDWSFDLAITSAFVDTTQMINVMKPKVAKNSIFHNDGDKDLEYKPTIVWKKRNSATHSVSDKHHWKAGTKVTNSFEASGGGVTASQSVSLSFEYGQEKTTTSSATVEEEFLVQEDLTLNLPPKSKKYVSLIVWVANAARVPLTVDFRLRAKRNGQPLSGRFLSTLTKAMVSDTKVTEVKTSEVTYRVYGSMTFDVASTSIVKVSDKPLTDEDIESMNPNRT